MSVIGSILSCPDRSNISIIGKQFKLLQCLVNLVIDLVPLLRLRGLINHLLDNKLLLVHHLLRQVFHQIIQLKDLMMQLLSRLIRNSLLRSKLSISSSKQFTILSLHLLEGHLI
jgi:hypothetical protein